jgi:tRNA threonylcarbamoyladenosine biosynthesis protein TsaB
MSAVIGFDTATDDTAVAAMRGGELLFSRSVERSGDGRPLHATRLLAEVEEAADAAGGWKSIGRIAVGVGPGSFTGLRIGIATAKGLAQGLEIELVSVGTLAALARGAAPTGTGELLLALLDARRAEVFGALYDAVGDPIWEPFVAGPSEVAGRIAGLPKPPLAVGSGALRFRDELQESGAVVLPDADPSHRVAAQEVCAIGALAAAPSSKDIAPIYLRPPDAERWRERDSTN